MSLLAPFRARITVVRRHPRPMAGAAEVVAPDALLSALAGADVVFLAPALTPETAGMIGERELRAMGPGAWLVPFAAPVRENVRRYADGQRSLA